jgi:CheY-like chemotaxis protein
MMSENDTSSNDTKNRQKIKILAVDDSKLIHALLDHFLKELGQEFVIVTTGKEAVEKVKNDGYNFIISDINMPKMNGYEVAHQVKDFSKEMNKKILVYAFTTSDDGVIKKKCAEAGFDGIFLKDSGLPDLVACIKENI